MSDVARTVARRVMACEARSPYGHTPKQGYRRDELCQRCGAFIEWNEAHQGWERVARELEALPPFPDPPQSL